MTKIVYDTTSDKPLFPFIVADNFNVTYPYTEVEPDKNLVTPFWDAQNQKWVELATDAQISVDTLKRMFANMSVSFTKSIADLQAQIDSLKGDKE